MLLIKRTHVQAGLCQLGCGLSALLEVDLEPWKVFESCALSSESLLPFASLPPGKGNEKANVAAL